MARSARHVRVNVQGLSKQLLVMFTASAESTSVLTAACDRGLTPPDTSQGDAHSCTYLTLGEDM